MDTPENSNKNTIVKIILLLGGLFGFIFTCSEVKSYGTFQEFSSNTYNLKLGFVKSKLVKYTYKSITIFIILTRKYTWYPYIIVYVLLLCSMVLNSKRFYASWLCISAIRSLFANTIVALTGLWFGLITGSSRWILLDFFLFKIFQIGLSAFYWYIIWTIYRAPVVIYISHKQPKKRQTSFHGFGWHNEMSMDSLNSTLNDDSSTGYLQEPSHESDHIFLDTVRQSRSLDSLITTKIVEWFEKETDSIVNDDDDSSSFSFNLAARAEKFLRLTPEEIGKLSKLHSTAIEDRRISNNFGLPRIQPLLTHKNYLNTLNEKSEIELKVIDMSASEEKNSRIVQNELLLTPEILLSIFYKYYYNEPITTMEESEDE